MKKRQKEAGRQSRKKAGRGDGSTDEGVDEWMDIRIDDERVKR